MLALMFDLRLKLATDPEARHGQDSRPRQLTQSGVLRDEFIEIAYRALAEE